MKGILLAGGSGTRLHPMTRSVSKQLLPIYNKPLVYYPLVTLMLAGIQEILIVTTPHEQALFQQLLGDGSQWGVALRYVAQPKPAGIAQAFLLEKDFVGNDPVCLMLGDNILHGQGMTGLLQQAVKQHDGATVFAYQVSDPERYGVLALDDDNNVIDIVEKPQKAPSPFAVTGLYFYDSDVVDIAKSLKPSARGELEITDVSRVYLQQKRLRVKMLGRGTAWLDTGTTDSLLAAGNFIQTLEQRQGVIVGSPEEAAWRMGWIDSAQLETLAQAQLKSGYGKALLTLLDQQWQPA